MQSANRLQKALKSGKPSFGAWQMLPGPNLSRTLARTPHLDWICIDTEHGNISDDGMHESVAATAACGLSPIVRVPEGQHWMIKRALDAGAHGVIVPLMRSVADVQAVVRACKFPPQGTRGLGSPFPMEKFVEQGTFGAGVKQVSMVEYAQQANSATLVIVQIETAEALEAVREIAAVEGLDVLLVGPFDLGNSIGHPVVKAEMDEELRTAIATVQKAAKEAGKHSAIFASSGAQARGYVDQGFDMVNVLTDVGALSKAFSEETEAARGSYLHAGVQGIKAGVGKMTTSGYGG